MFRVSMLVSTCLVLSQSLDTNIYESALIVPAKIGQWPDCALRHRTYCESVDKYPIDTITNLLNKRGDALGESTSFMFDENFDRYFNEADGYGPDSDMRTNISNNFGREWDEDGCRSWSTFIRPRAAMNEQKEWRYIVNVPTHKNQTLQIEYCEATDCNSQLKTRNRHKKAKCFQVIMSRELMALDPTGNMLIRENFLMPSCCQCNLVNV